MKKTCSKCNSTFDCEVSPSCWCNSFPKMTQSEINNDDCLCKNCLLEKYREKLTKNNQARF